MYYSMNGKMIFSSIDDLNYNLFNEIGLSVRPDQYVYDQDTGNVIQSNEKLLKASINGAPVYAGNRDIIFEPDKNYALMACLFGMYLDKAQHSDDGDLLQGYIAHYVFDDETRTKQQVVVKTVGRGEIASKFYYNVYLGYIECIFLISGSEVDLSNFDIPKEKEK